MVVPCISFAEYNRDSESYWKVWANAVDTSEFVITSCVRFPFVQVRPRLAVTEPEAKLSEAKIKTLTSGGKDRVEFPWTINHSVI